MGAPAQDSGPVCILLCSTLAASDELNLNYKHAKKVCCVGKGLLKLGLTLEKSYGDTHAE